MDKELLFKIKLAQDAQTGASLKKLADDVRATMREIEMSIGRVGAAAGNAMGGRTSTGTLPRSTPASFPRFSGGDTQGPTFSSPNDPLDRLRGSTTDDVVGPRHNTPRPTRNMPEPKQVPKDVAEDHSAIYEKNVQKITEYDEKSKTLTRNLKANFREAAERIEGGTSALAQFASGLGFLTAGNKDMEQFIKTLATIKGVSDVGVGLIKMFTNLSQIVTVNEDKQEMLSEKQELAAKKAAALTAATRSHKAMLDAEGSQLSEANAKLHEHANALDQVAASARGAANAEGQFGSATGGAATKANGAAGRGRGGRGGMLAGIGGMLGGEAITTFGGGGLASVLGGMGIESLIGRFAGGAGGAATGAGGSAAGGAAAAGGMGLAAMATVAAASAAALGAVSLVALELKETFQGTATKAGSLTDTIATWEVSIADWLGDMTGLFDVVTNSEQGAKADKALAERKKKNALDEIQNEGTSEFNVARRDSEEAMFGRDVADMSRLEKLNAEKGRDSLTGLGLNRDNLRAELAREAQTGKLYEGDKTAVGQQKLAESQERMERTRQQISSVNSLEQGIQAAGGIDSNELLEERKAKYAEELKKTMAEIQQLEADGVKYQGQYVDALAYAQQLSDKIVGTEEEQLALIKAQKQERAQYNKEAITAMNQRIQLVQQEGIAAKNALKSGAERFASMSGADQAMALRAAEQAKADGAESLSDKQRGLLRSIGTQGAVSAAEQADHAEAEKKGFFKTFGDEERAKIQESDTQVKQLKVEIANRESVAVTIENDYKKMAAEVESVVRKMLEQMRPEFAKDVESKLNQKQRESTKRTQELYEKQRALNKSN